MNESDVLDLLERVGAFRKGHFVFTSGRHGDTYINKDAIYPYTRETSALCKAMAERFKDDDIEVVIGPAVGAAILSQWVAHHLSLLNGRDVLSVYADKDLPAPRDATRQAGGSGGFILRRGYDRVAAGKNVLVVEDLMTTGGSVKKVITLAKGAGATVAGVGVVCNRGGVTAKDVGALKLTSLVNVQLDSWEASDCILCERKIPVNEDVGHGRAFTPNTRK